MIILFDVSWSIPGRFHLPRHGKTPPGDIFTPHFILDQNLSSCSTMYGDPKNTSQLDTSGAKRESAGLEARIERVVSKKFHEKITRLSDVNLSEISNS